MAQLPQICSNGCWGGVLFDINLCLVRSQPEDLDEGAMGRQEKVGVTAELNKGRGDRSLLSDLHVPQLFIAKLVSVGTFHVPDSTAGAKQGVL